jgi:hypothetical protein
MYESSDRFTREVVRWSGMCGPIAIERAAASAAQILAA